MRDGIAGKLSGTPFGDNVIGLRVQPKASVRRSWGGVGPGTARDPAVQQRMTDAFLMGREGYRKVNSA
jgi:hypothetical protein